MSGAESLESGAGSADFDTSIRIVAGPARVGEQLFLGGVPKIEIGKLEPLPIALPGPKVSRLHALLGAP